jgi:toxin ParE1/3/4
MNVFRRDSALADLADHAFYLAEDAPDVADRFIDAFEAAAERLSQMPHIGATYPTGNPALFGLRRWPLKGFEKYLIFYLVFEDAVDIVRIIHSSRDLARILDKTP